jgi:hypothetical protein
MKITAIDIIFMCFIVLSVEYLSNKTFEYVKRKIESKKQDKEIYDHRKKFLESRNKHGQ